MFDTTRGQLPSSHPYPHHSANPVTVTRYIEADTECASLSRMIFTTCGMKLAMEQHAAATPKVVAASDAAIYRSAR